MNYREEKLKELYDLLQSRRTIYSHVIMELENGKQMAGHFKNNQIISEVQFKEETKGHQIKPQILTKEEIRRGIESFNKKY